MFARFRNASIGDSGRPFFLHNRSCRNDKRGASYLSLYGLRLLRCFLHNHNKTLIMRTNTIRSNTIKKAASTPLRKTPPNRKYRVSSVRLKPELKDRFDKMNRLYRPKQPEQRRNRSERIQPETKLG